MSKVTIDRELLELSLNGDEQQQAKARNKLRSILAHPAQQGEAVEVVGIRISTDGFGSYIADSAMGIGAVMPGEVREPLMTVAQHQRILAARGAEGCKVVPVELIERTICRLTHGHEHDKAVRELRALLVSAEGVKDE